MSVSPRLRFEVLKRDEFRCAYCGVTSEAKDLQVDHIVARASGGTDEITNLITACRDCNQGKSDKPLEIVHPTVREGAVAEIEERVDRTIRYAKAVALERQTKDALIGRVMAAWFEAWPGAGHKEADALVLDRGEFPTRRSVEKFLEQLPVDRVLSCIDTTAAKFAWPYAEAVRYFAGCCWRLIKTNDIEHRYEELQTAYAELNDYVDHLRRDVAELEAAVRERDETIDGLRRQRPKKARPRLAKPLHIREILEAAR